MAESMEETTEIAKNGVKSKTPTTLTFGNMTPRGVTVKKSSKSPSGINNKLNRIRKEVLHSNPCCFLSAQLYSLFLFFS